MGALDDLLNNKDLLEYIFRNPELRNARMGMPDSEYQRPQRSDAQIMTQGMGEAAAVGDPFGATAIARLLGYSPPGQVLINESHGLANRETERYRKQGR